MKPIPLLASLLCLLLATAAARAEMLIEPVSKARAKQLGLEVRAQAAGPDAVWIELSLDPNNPGLKDLDHVSLELRDAADKLLLSTPLKQTPQPSGRHTVSLTLARDTLGRATLRIVTGSPRDYAGHDLKLSDFVDRTQVK
jgi:hypothetical protein